MKNSEDLRAYAKYTALHVLGMIGLSCYILADTFFVSKALGTNGLAALNLAIPVYSIVHGTGLLIGIGGGMKFSILRGGGNREDANRVFSQAVWICAAFGLLFLITGVYAADPIVRLLGADAQVFGMTCTYIRWILLFAPAFLANNLLLCFVRNDGSPQLSMAAMLVSSLSNVLLDYLFLFPLGMGMFGAVLATGLSPLIGILILMLHMLGKKNTIRISRCGFDGKTVAGIFSGGVPSLIAELSSGVVMMVFNALFLTLRGNTGVAAYGVIANLSLVVVSIYTGLAQGMQPLVSSSIGAGDIARAQRMRKYALFTALFLSVLLYAGLYLGAEQVAGIFNSEGNAALQEMAVRGVKLYFIACPFVGFNGIVAMYMTATEHVLPAQILSLLRGFFLVIPAALLLSRFAGETGVWCAFPVTECAATAGIVLYAAGKRRKTLF